MFQFPGCPPMTLFCSGHGDGALPPPGFPIRISMDQSPACGSPWLNAACHVLLRQSVPWHSPCALICLIFCQPFAAAPSLRIAPLVCRFSQAPLRSRSVYVCRHIHAPYSCSLILSLCFPCAVFKMRMKTAEPLSPSILQNDTACERLND